MSQENVGIVLHVYDALNQRDWDAVFRDFDQEAEVTMQRGPGAGTHRRREVQGVLQDYVETFESMVFEPEEVFEHGNEVVVLLTRRARPKAGSGEMVVRNGHIWTIREGSIVSMTSFPDPDQALEAAGLSE